MRNKITGIIAAALLLTALAGCDNTANENATVNRNANATPATTSTPIPGANANANTNAAQTRRAPTREEYERDKERYNREAKESGRTVGTGLTMVGFG